MATKKASSRRSTAKTPSPKRKTKVVHPVVFAIVHDGQNKEGHERPIDVEQAKELLGWQEIEKGEFQFKDYHGKKVRVAANIRNRPIYSRRLAELKQEILRGNWLLNGETVIVSRTGTLLNGQHRLIALVLAHQEWETVADWQAANPKAPTLSVIVIYGIDGADKVVNTMDTCKPRTLADVLYRSKHFESTKPSDRFRLSKICESAIRILWVRTGARSDEVSHELIRNHSESIAFLERHPRLLEAVSHIYSEDGTDGRIRGIVSLGAAAALLYLMGCSKSDRDEYRVDDVPQETNLDWSMMNQAQDFFTLLPEDPKLGPVKMALIKLMEDTGTASLSERMAIVAKAWALWSTGGSAPSIQVKELELEYEEQADGSKRLVEYPTVGGIDVAEDPNGHDDPTEDEIVEETTRIRKAKAAKAMTPEDQMEVDAVRPKRKRRTEPAKADDKPRKPKGANRGRASTSKVGQTYWVVDPTEGPLASLHGVLRGYATPSVAKLEIATGYPGAGTITEVPVKHLRENQPEPE